MPNCQPSHVLRQLSQLSTRRRLWRFSWFGLLGCLAAYDKGEERKKPPKNPRHGYLEESLNLAKDLTLYKTLLLWLLWLTETRKTIGNNFGSFLSSKPYISSGYQWSWETPWSVGGHDGTAELNLSCQSPTKIHSAPWARPSFCHSPAKRPEGHRDTLGITAKFRLWVPDMDSRKIPLKTYSKRMRQTWRWNIIHSSHNRCNLVTE